MNKWVIFLHRAFRGKKNHSKKMQTLLKQKGTTLHDLCDQLVLSNWL